MIVRRAEEGDLPDIVRLAGAFHAESPVHNWLPFSAVKVHQLVTHAIGAADWLPVVAYDTGGLAGMALMCAAPVFFSDAIEVLDLTFFVAADRRGGLAARSMLVMIEAWARQLDAARVIIAPNTGIEHERTARFFRMLGFEKTGEALTKIVR